MSGAWGWNRGGDTGGWGQDTSKGVFVAGMCRRVMGMMGRDWGMASIEPEMLSFL